MIKDCVLLRTFKNRAKGIAYAKNKRSEEKDSMYYGDIIE